MLCLSATIQKLPANTSILHSQLRPCKRTTTHRKGERDREKKMPIDNSKTCIDGKSYVNFKMLQRINECFNGNRCYYFSCFTLSSFLSMSMSVCMKMMRSVRMILVDILRSIHPNVYYGPCCSKAH